MNDPGRKDLRPQGEVLGVGNRDGEQLWTASATSIEDLTILRQLKEAEVSQLRHGWQISQAGVLEADLLRLGVQRSVAPSGQLLAPVTVQDEVQRSGQQDMRQGSTVQNAWHYVPQTGQVVRPQQQHQSPRIAVPQVHQSNLTIDFSSLTPEKRNSILEKINQNQNNMQREIARLENLKQEVIIGGSYNPNLEQLKEVKELLDSLPAADTPEQGSHVLTITEDESPIAEWVVCGGRSEDQSVQDQSVLKSISVVGQGATLVPQELQTVDHSNQGSLEERLRGNSISRSLSQPQVIHLPAEPEADVGNDGPGLGLHEGGLTQKLWVQNGTIGGPAIELRPQLCEQDSMEVAKKLISVIAHHTHPNGSAGRGGVGVLEGNNLDYQVAVMKKLKQAFGQLDPNAQELIRSSLAVLAGSSSSMDSEVTVCDADTSQKAATLQLDPTPDPHSSTVPPRTTMTAQQLGSLLDRLPQASQEARAAGAACPLYDRLARACEGRITSTPVFECVPNVSGALIYDTVQLRADESKQEW